ncbi:uncharacterized protein LOC133869203 [Alnus glutinosa]|uniref:uncharacterized protein LOC133869203 n=1 Tax=Alnus glutinosa TaxID=3517 RepID=UPI002D7A02B2|nr:uncharacterized protein LOC133869203 [Alnus glutinosa]
MGVDPQHVVREPPIVGSDDTTQDPMETQDGVDSQQFGSSAQSVPETSHHSGSSRVPRMLRGGKVHTIDEQGRRNVRTVGSPKDIWHIPDGERIVIQFNAAHQPMGPGSEKFRRICGKIVRNGRFINLHGNWRKLPPEGKEQMWLALTKKFYMEPVHDIVNIKRLTLMDLANKRRQFRHEGGDSANF